MMAMKEFSTELQRTPSLNHVSAQSPRVGGCVGTFFHMFDWNPGKKRGATKRLPAERLEEEHYVRRERSFKEGNAKRSLNEDATRGCVQHAAADKISSRSPPETSKLSEEDHVPGVVARLMGLESLPKTSSSTAGAAALADHVVVPNTEAYEDQKLQQEELMPCAPVTAPVLLQELLRQEGFKDSSRKSLKEKLPGFSRKASPDQKKKQEGEVQRRKTSGMRAVRGIAADPHVHPYVDPRIPRPSRRKTEEPKQQCVGSNLHNGGPVLLPSKSHNQLLTSSPMQSPSNFGSKHTARLLETAAKILEPNMQKPSSQILSLPSTESHSYTAKSECRSSVTKSERQGFSNQRSASVLHSSSCKISRTESMARSWSGKEEKDNDLGEISGRMSEAGSVMQARRIQAAVSNNELLTLQQQEQASKWRFESALAAHSQAVLSPPTDPPRCKRNRPSNPRNGGINSANHVLSMHEASIRGFKTELVAKSLTNVAKDRSSHHSRSFSETAYVTVLHEERIKGVNGIQSCEAASLFGTEFLPPDRECSDPPNSLVVVNEPISQDKAAKNEVVEVGTLSSGALDDRNLDKDSVSSAQLIVKLRGNGRRAPPPPNGGFNWGMQKGFKGRAARQEKDVGQQDSDQVGILSENGFPTNLQHGLLPPAATMTAALPPTPVKSMGGSLLRYRRLFSLSKPGGKKERQEKGEGLVMKRPENLLMRRSIVHQHHQSAAAASPSPENCSTAQALITSAKQGRMHQCDGGVNLKTDAGREKATAPQSEACLGAAAALDMHLSDINGQVNLSPHSERETTSSSSLLLSHRCEGRDGSMQQHMRARSVDEVFPELPLDEINSDTRRRRGGGQNSPLKSKAEELMIDNPILRFQSTGQEQGWFDCQSEDHVFGTRSLSRNFLALSEGRIPDDDMFVTEHSGMTFPSSPLVYYNETVLFSEQELPTSNFQQHVLVMDSNSSLFTTDPNGGGGGKDSHQNFQKCLQEETTDADIVSDDDDEEESVGADLDTCSTCAVCDASSTPDRLEIQKMHLDAGWSEDAVSPNLLKKFNEDSSVSSMQLNRPECQFASLSSVMDECGQPSPVSVLESHLLDESPTNTPDTSLTEPEQQLDEGLEDMRSCEAGLVIEESHEKEYVREILEASPFWEYKDATSSSNWVLPQIPALLDTSLFARLEFGSSGFIEARELYIMKSKQWGEKAASCCRIQTSWRCNRKLLFDAVNEALAFQFEYGYCDCEPWMNVRNSIRPRIFGPQLAAEIYRKLCKWQEMTADDLVDNLIDCDMSVAEGKWTDFSWEVVEVGLHVERMLLKIMIEELVDDFCTISGQRVFPTSKNLNSLNS